LNPAKSFPITKHQVWEAYKRVKANHGGAGIDAQTLEKFDQDLSNNLYKLWNRMASGSYLPPPVKRVDIPKANGGTRSLGIPTVADRIAQTVVKQVLEPELEKYFHPDSYGYRPERSAHQALSMARKRCWTYNWVLEFDIKGYFDNIDHDLLMRAVRKHTQEKWVLLYLERWLKAPVQMADGPVWRHLNRKLVLWAARKYKHFRGHLQRAENWLLGVARSQPDLFAHWRLFYGRKLTG
jgi:group II intron reverse transcriptase/maturase